MSQAAQYQFNNFFFFIHRNVDYITRRFGRHFGESSIESVIIIVVVAFTRWVYSQLFISQIINLELFMRCVTSNTVNQLVLTKKKMNVNFQFSTLKVPKVLLSNSTRFDSHCWEIVAILIKLFEYFDELSISSIFDSIILCLNVV